MVRSWHAWVMAAIAVSAVAAGEEEPSPQATYDRLLREYVSPDGVRWAAWAAADGDRAALSRVTEELAEMRPSGLPVDARLAYWINLYNALTLELVLEHYPVGSIREIGGPGGSPWKRDLVTVEGREVSLDEIENAILRVEFSEPRIHFALNCAARSCPPLRAEAFSAARLDEQLEEQTVRFLGDPRENGVDDEGRLHLSPVFEWYAADFENAAGSVAAWVRTYLDGAPEGAEIRYREYDWSLNEAPGRPEGRPGRSSSEGGG
jgi:hypothetical protein